MFGNVLTSIATDQGRQTAGAGGDLGVCAHDALPGIPTVGEFVPGYEAVSVYGIGAPSGHAARDHRALNREINAGLADPAIKERLVELGSSAFATRRGRMQNSSPLKRNGWARW